MFLQGDGVSKPASLSSWSSDWATLAEVVRLASLIALSRLRRPDASSSTRALLMATDGNGISNEGTKPLSLPQCPLALALRAALSGTKRSYSLMGPRGASGGEPHGANVEADRADPGSLWRELQ